MTATATSISAFHATTSERERKCASLLYLYQNIGAMSDREASYRLGWDRSDVSARRNDLKGVVVGLGEKKDPQTGKTVNVYGIARETLF